jgi:glycosyltransferase involved in cell wall biosynthesis
MKTILIIAYYFPPSVDAGSKRAFGFYRHLAGHGYRPLILTVEGGNYLTVASDAPKDSPDVFRVRPLKSLLRPRNPSAAPAEHPHRESQLRGLVRRVFRELVYVPDGYGGFVRPAYRRATQLIREYAVDLVFTMSTPFSALRIGFTLNERLGIPWVADFRDLWTGYHGGYPYSRLRRTVDEYLERRWLSRARCLVTVGEGLRRTLEGQFPGKPVYAISNGYLDRNVGSLQPSPGRVLRVSFTGTLYEDFDHTIVPLCEALHCLQALAADAFRRLTVEFVGSVNRRFGEVREQFGLKDVIQYRGRVGPDEVARIQQEADLLLILIPEGLVDAIPTKTFEYMASGRPILFIGPPEAEGARVIDATKAGKVFTPHDRWGIARFLLDLIKMKEGGTTIRSDISPVDLRQFSYDALAAKLARVFDSIQTDG